MNLNVDDFDNLDSTSKSRGFEIMAILRFEFQNMELKNYFVIKSFMIIPWSKTTSAMSK